MRLTLIGILSQIFLTDMRESVWQKLKINVSLFKVNTLEDFFILKEKYEE